MNGYYGYKEVQYIFFFPFTLLEFGLSMGHVKFTCLNHTKYAYTRKKMNLIRLFQTFPKYQYIYICIYIYHKTIITKRSILDVAAVLDPPLLRVSEVTESKRHIAF